MQPPLRPTVQFLTLFNLCKQFRFVIAYRVYCLIKCVAKELVAYALQYTLQYQNRKIKMHFIVT